MVIVAACGERANEVVELFTEFPELEDRVQEENLWSVLRL
jgi:vacuolar-type H+-ATPase catalytic subunit A/Vma1